jgi:ferrous iron transport protein B
VAYATAVIFYQVANMVIHPGESLFWIAGMLLCLMTVMGLLYYTNSNARRVDVIADT